MAHFNLDNYAPVEHRIAEFYARFPEGRVVTELVTMQDGLVVMKAQVFRDREAPPEMPDATGYAYEKEGSTPVNRTSYVENCETSAIGRALANLNFPGHINGSKAPRPSREEMRKAQAPDGYTHVGSELVHKETGAVVEDMNKKRASEADVERLRAVLLELAAPTMKAAMTPDEKKLAGYAHRIAGKEDATEGLVLEHYRKMVNLYAKLMYPTDFTKQAEFADNYMLPETV